MRDMIYILSGYLAGSILFARVFGWLLKKTDVTENTSDGNPGTANAFQNGGFLCGALTLVCDLLKGFLPVFLYTRGQTTFLLALVIAAPERTSVSAVCCCWSRSMTATRSPKKCRAKKATLLIWHQDLHSSTKEPAEPYPSEKREGWAHFLQ